MAKKKESIQDSSEITREQEDNVYDTKYRRRKIRERSYIGAFVVIFIGVVFLLNNLGILPWEAWRQIWRLWPILLILFGIEMIFGRSRWAQIIIGILVILFLLGIVWYFLLVQGVVAPMHFRYPNMMYPLQ
jgi:predicted ferric reductase